MPGAVNFRLSAFAREETQDRLDYSWWIGDRRQVCGVGKLEVPAVGDSLSDFSCAGDEGVDVLPEPHHKAWHPNAGQRLEPFLIPGDELSGSSSLVRAVVGFSRPRRSGSLTTDRGRLSPTEKGARRSSTSPAGKELDPVRLVMTLLTSHPAPLLGEDAYVCL